MKAELTLTGASAFRYYQTPPQVLALLPPISAERDYKRHALCTHPLVKESLGLPLCLLTSSPGARTGAKSVSWALIREDLPYGVIEDTPFNLQVTNPALTLLTLARRLSMVDLVMAIYEMTGYFSIYAPSSEMERALLKYAGSFVSEGINPWRRCASTDLWQHEPTATVQELLDFCNAAQGIQGVRKLKRAISLINGCVASPFEAQVTMLLTLPRSLGGQGFKGLKNNREIKLYRNAAIIGGKDKCYADLYFEGDDAHPPFAIECQGRVFHGSSGLDESDADRLMALESQGIKVLPLTYQQIANVENYRMISELIAARMGRSIRPKTDAFKRAENELRYRLLRPWNPLLNLEIHK